MKAAYFFTLGALIGAAVAIGEMARVDRQLAAFFESCDRSLHVLEDM